MAKKTVADAAKAKQAKQKKIVILLGAVFALAMVYAFMTISGMQSGGGTKPMAAPPPTAGSPTAATPSTTSTAAPTLAGSTPTAATSTPSSTPSADGTTSTDSSALVSVVTPPMDPGQLQSFDRFASKDPFNTSPDPNPNPNPGNDVCPNIAGPQPSVPSGYVLSNGKCILRKVPPPPHPPVTSATISVNGTQELVSVGADFPSTNPLFQLTSATTTTAKIGVAGGSYSTGQPTLTLTTGTPVTLQNTADGTRYTLILLPQSAVAPPNTGSSGAAPTSITPPTTPSTTTTPTSTGP